MKRFDLDSMTLEARRSAGEEFAVLAPGQRRCPPCADVLALETTIAESALGSGR